MVRRVHELKIKALIWRHGHLGCWIITAQGRMHSVWSHTSWVMWRLPTWPDSEVLGLCWDIVCVVFGITMHGRFSRRGEISAWRVRDGELFGLVFMGSWECHWMLVQWDEWQSISFYTLMFTSLWPYGVDRMEMIRQHNADDAMLHWNNVKAIRVMRWHWGSTPLHLSLFVWFSSSHQNRAFHFMFWFPTAGATAGISTQILY